MRSRSSENALECGDLSPLCAVDAAGLALEKRQVAALHSGATFALEHWDGGRLTVNGAFAAVLEAAGLTTFESLWSFAGGRVAKNVLRERTTTRLTVPDESRGGEVAFYLKRHAPAPWKEYLKPLLRLRRPLVGARHEWNAILRFHEVGISTMTPVALGQSGRRSLLLTEAIEGCHKLSELAGSVGRTASPSSRADAADARRSAAWVPRIARTARAMHAAGLHHQDFYLTHLLVPAEDDGQTLYVIDLGRVRQRRPGKLSRRWIVKDLAQLNYSASCASDADRQQFLECYFGRSLERGDRRLLRQIDCKTRAIARHSRKHRL